MSTLSKDPVKSRAGAIGARARWGPRRVVRLDALPPEVAGVVRALVDAATAEKAERSTGPEAA